MPSPTTSPPSLPVSLPPLPPVLTSLLTLPRSQKDLETFPHRKAEIMRKFSLSQIQALYEEETAKVLLMLEEDQRNNEEINKEIEKLEKQQELERRIYSKMPSRRDRDEEKVGLGIGMGLGNGMGTENGSGEEGEVLEDVKMEGV